jgi:hypothetical protein
VQDLSVEVRSVAENVSVGIDQSRQDRGLGQIQYFGVCGHLHSLRWADLNNAIPFDQYHLIGGELLGAVE